LNFPTLVGKSRADAGGGTWILDANSNQTLRARIDSQALGTGSGNPGFNQGVLSNTAIGGDQWHHLALTYDDATRNVKLYVDYVEKASATTTNPIVYDNSALLMGQGAGGRALDGWLDEVRLTEGVLTTDQMLRAENVAIPEPAAGVALALAGAAAVGRRRR
jgi:hypothetical protein